MPDYFLIERTFLKHEKGTKFYQAFKISRFKSNGQLKPTSAVTLVHYGPVSAVRMDDPRPVTGGSSIVYSGGEVYDSKISAKKSGGYEVSGRENIECESPEQLNAFMVRQFGATRRDEILIKLGLAAITGEPIETDAAEPDPSDEGEDTPIDKFAGRPATWGSW